MQEYVWWKGARRPLSLSKTPDGRKGLLSWAWMSVQAAHRPGDIHSHDWLSFVGLKWGAESPIIPRGLRFITGWSQYLQFELLGRDEAPHGLLTRIWWCTMCTQRYADVRCSIMMWVKSSLWSQPQLFASVSAGRRYLYMFCFVFCGLSDTHDKMIVMVNSLVTMFGHRLEDLKH